MSVTPLLCPLGHGSGQGQEGTFFIFPQMPRSLVIPHGIQGLTGSQRYSQSGPFLTSWQTVEIVQSWDSEVGGEDAEFYKPLEFIRSNRKPVYTLHLIPCRVPISALPAACYPNDKPGTPNTSLPLTPTPSVIVVSSQLMLMKEESKGEAEQSKHGHLCNFTRKLQLHTPAPGEATPPT